MAEALRDVVVWARKYGAKCDGGAQRAAGAASAEDDIVGVARTDASRRVIDSEAREGRRAHAKGRKTSWLTKLRSQIRCGECQVRRLPTRSERVRRVVR